MWGYMSNKNYEISSNHSRHALSDSQLIYALEFGITVIQNKPWKIIAVAWGFGFTQDKIWFDEFYSLKLVLYKLHFKFNTIRLNVQALLSLTPENLTKSCRDYFQNFYMSWLCNLLSLSTATERLVEATTVVYSYWLLPSLQEVRGLIPRPYICTVHAFYFLHPLFFGGGEGGDDDEHILPILLIIFINLLAKKKKKKKK